MRFPGRIQLRPQHLAGILSPVLLLCLAAFPPGPAYADGIGGSVEFANTLSEGKSRNAGVETDKSKSNTFAQRYSLSLDRSIFPLLKLTAGGIFDKNMTDSTINGVDSSSDATTISPHVNLNIGTSPVTAGLGYARSETTTSGSISADVLETYNARLGLRPEGLPTLDLLASRSNSFDKNRVAHDNTSDFYSLNSRYQPAANLTLNYSGSFSDARDRLSDQQTQSLSNALRGDYTRQFLNNRVSFSTSGTLSNQESKIVAGSAGEISTTLARQAGFFAADNNPLLILAGSWTSTPALIDSDRVAPIAAINLGVPPVVGGETRPRNLGLDLALPTTAVNTMRVFVRVGLTTPQQLPATIVTTFFNPSRWDVYTSVDNERWVLQPGAVQSVNFVTEVDPTLLPPLNTVSRFELEFSSTITTRYIKVVVSPLPLIATAPGVDLTSILVTELEAAVRTPTTGIPGQTTSSQSGFLDTAVRAKIFDRPGVTSVLYDVSVSYHFSQQDTGTSTSSHFIANGLSANHRFNRYLTGTARLAAEESGQSGQSGQSSYSFSASLQAVPLSTLRHTLVYSSRYSRSASGDSSSNSVALTNSAQLYQGISASLTGGVSFATGEDGAESQNTFATVGVNLTPHRTVSLNAGLTENHSETSGGARAASSSFSRSGEVSATYNPISAVFLFGSVGFSAQNDRETVISRNFGGGWSPFRDGAIQLNLSYNESLSSVGDQRTRIFSSSLRWNIRPGWWLDTTYATVSTEQTAGVAKNETEADSISSTLRIAF